MFAKLEAFLRKNFHFLLAVAVVLCLLHYRYGKSSFVAWDGPNMAYGTIDGFRENLDLGGIDGKGYVTIGTAPPDFEDTQDFEYRVKPYDRTDFQIRTGGKDDYLTAAGDRKRRVRF